MNKIAQCKYCRRADLVSNLNKVKSYAHNYFYVCDRCKGTLGNYTTENDTFIHGNKAHGFTYSFEFEVTNRPLIQNLFYEYKFVPTSDCTVDTEWKTPVYKSKCGLHQMFRSIEKVTHNCLGEACSTHMNIGNTNFINGDTLNIIAEYYSDLMHEYNRYLESHEMETAAVYGRSQSDWAAFSHRVYSSDLSVTNLRGDTHAIFLNLQHSNWLEFRLCKFVNANQYMQCLKLNESIVHCFGNFIEYYQSNNYTPIELKHKAQVISRKCIKLFNKAYLELTSDIAC
jgi:hypothetical protein